MDAADHAVASALYALEAIQSGVTTFVELPDPVFMGGDHDVEAIVAAKLDEYDAAGVRNVYAQTFRDNPDIPEGFRTFIERLRDREPSVDHLPLGYARRDVDEVADLLEDLVSAYHDPGPGSRQRVWMAPEHVWTASPEGLERAYDFARRHDAMTTTHVSETTHEEAAVGGSHQSMVEYLDTVGYLGDRALLAHCVHLNDRDIRLLAETDTNVSHNISANLALGAGVAPIYELRTHDVTVGLGTDNATTSDAIDILGDARMALFAQRGTRRDPTIMEPMDVLEMATIHGADAIGRGDEIGSIESGKRADITLIDLDTPPAIPRYDLHSAVVLQLYRQSADTVLCNGEVILDSGTAPELDDEFDDLHTAAAEVSEDIIRRTGVVEVFDGIV
jgi:cytosine/adenosine deaminase-related metal-dependent hydrolase